MISLKGISSPRQRITFSKSFTHCEIFILDMLIRYQLGMRYWLKRTMLMPTEVMNVSNIKLSGNNYS